MVLFLIPISVINEVEKLSWFDDLTRYHPVSIRTSLAASLIEEAEKRGQIKPGVTTLVEPTSGNTGVALAMVAAVRGYDLVLTMPDTMSLERRVVLKVRAEVVVRT